MNTNTPGTVRHFTLKVTLLGVEPPVWRRFRVPGSCTLLQLHQILQVLMDWQDMHLHDFQIGERYFGRPTTEEDADFLADERDHRLDHLVKRVGTRIRYRYDFGDDWRHEIRVERIGDAAPGGAAVECLDGARAGPPEDCGGPPGYEILRRILAEPGRPEFADVREAYESFDPERFDLAGINRQLRAFR